MAPETFSSRWFSSKITRSDVSRSNAEQLQSTLFFDSLLAQAEAAAEFAQQTGADHAVSFGEVQLRQGAEDPSGAGGPVERDG